MSDDTVIPIGDGFIIIDEGGDIIIGGDITTDTGPIGVEWEADCCEEFIDIDEVPDGYVLKYDEASGSLTWGHDTAIDADGRVISFDIPIPSGIITMRDRPKQFDQPKEVQMLDFTNILIVAVIALIVCKVIAPRLTWLNVFKAFIRLILKPFNRKSAEVQDQWQKAKYDEEIQ